MFSYIGKQVFQGLKFYKAIQTSPDLVLTEIFTFVFGCTSDLFVTIVIHN